jgi:hypothetical protein
MGISLFSNLTNPSAVNTAVVGYLRQKLGMDVDAKECFEKAKNWISKSIKKTGS